MPGEEDFVILTILAEIGMAMGHGSTCVTNAFLYASDLAPAAGTSSSLLTSIKVLCAFGVGLGVFVSGAKVTKRMGTKYVSYTTTVAFTAQFTSMAVTLLSSVIGCPISTTQSFVFALLGLKLFHNDPKIIHMERRVLWQSIVWWVVAIPVSLFVPLIISEVTCLITDVNA